MAKPIFIIKFNQLPYDEACRTEIVDKIKQAYPGVYEDYHVMIMFCDLGNPEIDFKIFSSKEIEPIELEKLKEILNLKADERGKTDITENV